MARTLFIRQGCVPHDPRVTRQIEALARDGHEVDVICKRHNVFPNYEHRPPITIHRLPMVNWRAGPLAYALKYAAFGLMATLLAGYLHLRRRYDLVQVNSLPDTLVFAAVVPKLRGARVVLDLQDPMPELFATRFGRPMDHLAVRAVGWVEQLCIRFADHAVTCTEPMRRAFARRGSDPDKISVVLNAADEEIFDPERHPPRERTSGRFDLICHGTIVDRYGIDLLIRAVALLKDEIPELRLKIYGTGPYLPALRQLVAELGVDDRVWFSQEWVSIERMVAAIADADVGVVPMRRDAFRDITHCNKMFDFIAMRRPAIVSRTSSVEAYFNEGCFEMFSSGDIDGLARAIRHLHDHPGRGAELVDQVRRQSEPYRWSHQRDAYQKLIRRLLGMEVPAATVSRPAD